VSEENQIGWCWTYVTGVRPFFLSITRHITCGHKKGPFSLKAVWTWWRLFEIILERWSRLQEEWRYCSWMPKRYNNINHSTTHPWKSGIVSMVYTQSEGTVHQTRSAYVSSSARRSVLVRATRYTMERIVLTVPDTPNREVMAHLKAVCFIRPTAENITLLKKELRKPKYGEYYFCTCKTFLCSLLCLSP
jgi:hypothetical protein